MHGLIFNYLISEIEYLDDRKNVIIERKLSYSDRDLNTNYRKMTHSSLDKNLHRKIHECTIYSDDFEFIKKCMFSIFELYEFKENILFLFSKIGNGHSLLSIFEKGYGYPIFRPSNSDLLYTITTDTRKQYNVRPLSNMGINQTNYSDFDKEFERQKKVAIEKELFEKQRQLAFKEHELREKELNHKEFLLKEQQQLELKKQELAVLELEQQKKAFEEKQLQIGLTHISGLPTSNPSYCHVKSKSNPPIVVAKASKKSFTKKLTPRRSPRLEQNEKKRFSF